MQMKIKTSYNNNDSNKNCTDNQHLPAKMGKRQFTKPDSVFEVWEYHANSFYM